MDLKLGLEDASEDRAALNVAVEREPCLSWMGQRLTGQAVVLAESNEVMKDAIQTLEECGWWTAQQEATNYGEVLSGDFEVSAWTGYG